jgi:hypothetical protein
VGAGPRAVTRLLCVVAILILLLFLIGFICAWVWRRSRRRHRDL